MNEYIISDLKNVYFEEDESAGFYVAIIDDEEFYKNIEYASSHISSAVVAKITGLKHNKDSVFAEVGDIFYMARVYDNEIYYFVIEYMPSYIFDSLGICDIYDLEEILQFLVKYDKYGLVKVEWGWLNGYFEKGHGWHS